MCAQWDRPGQTVLKLEEISVYRSKAPATGDLLAVAVSWSLPPPTASADDAGLSPNGSPVAPVAGSGLHRAAAKDEQRRMCFSRVLGTENGVEHQTQVRASRPTRAWVLMCRVSLLDCAHAYGHMRQRYGFSPVCERRWTVRLLQLRNTFPQYSHVSWRRRPLPAVNGRADGRTVTRSEDPCRSRCVCLSTTAGDMKSGTLDSGRGAVGDVRRCSSALVTQLAASRSGDVNHVGEVYPATASFCCCCCCCCCWCLKNLIWFQYHGLNHGSVESHPADVSITSSPLLTSPGWKWSSVAPLSCCSWRRNWNGSSDWLAPNARYRATRWSRASSGDSDDDDDDIVVFTSTSLFLSSSSATSIGRVSVDERVTSLDVGLFISPLSSSLSAVLELRRWDRSVGRSDGLHVMASLSLGRRLVSDVWSLRRDALNWRSVSVSLCGVLVSSSSSSLDERFTELRTTSTDRCFSDVHSSVGDVTGAALLETDSPTDDIVGW